MGKLGQWLQVGANIGILAGLILVALQIKQSNSFVEVQVTTQAWNEELSMSLKMIGEEPQKAWTKAISDPDNLADEDVVILNEFLHYKMGMIGHYEEMERAGFGNNMEYLMGSLVDELNTVFGRRWWDAVKKRGLYKRYSDRVDQVLAKFPMPRIFDRDFLDELKGLKAEV